MGIGRSPILRSWRRKPQKIVYCHFVHLNSTSFAYKFCTMDHHRLCETFNSSTTTKKTLHSSARKRNAFNGTSRGKNCYDLIKYHSNVLGKSGLNDCCCCCRCCWRCHCRLRRPMWTSNNTNDTFVYTFGCHNWMVAGKQWKTTCNWKIKSVC